MHLLLLLLIKDNTSEETDVARFKLQTCTFFPIKTIWKDFMTMTFL